MFNNGGEDNIESLVIEIGTSKTRIGFAGEDVPKYQEFTSIAKNANHYYVKTPDEYHTLPSSSSSSYSLVSPIGEEGYITQWDHVETLFNDACLRQLKVKALEHPVLFAEPNHAPTAFREECLSFMFEKYDIPALFLSKTAVLSCFANGKSTGLVVDIGAGHTSIVPVHEGYGLAKNMQRSPMAGNELDLFLYKQIKNITKKSQVHARCEAVLNPTTTTSSSSSKRPSSTSTPLSPPVLSEDMIEFARRHVIAQVKENVCRVSDMAFDEISNAHIPKLQYELPDGTKVHVGAGRFNVPECLFVNGKTITHEKEYSSLQKMITQVAGNCELDLRRDLFHNIVLTGGSSCFENLQNRLEREVLTIVPNMNKLKILASHPNERKHSAWLGGSILASLGSFHEMWISKAEFQEHGTSIVHRKCP